MLCGWEGNRRSGELALAMRHRVVNQSINQSIRDCLSNRATFRLIIKCIETAGSDDNVRI